MLYCNFLKREVIASFLSVTWNEGLMAKRHSLEKEEYFIGRSPVF